MVGSINGSFGSPVVGVFLLASTVPWVNKYGVVTGVVSSVAFMLTLTLGGQTYGALPRPLPPAPVSHCHITKPDNSLLRPDSVPMIQSISNQSLPFDLKHNNDFDLTSLNATLSQAAGYDLTNSTRQGYNQIALGVSGAAESSSSYDPKFFLFDISYEWYTVLGTLFCMVIGLLVSFLTRNTGPKADLPSPDLMMPFCRRYWLERGFITKRMDSTPDAAEPLKKSLLEVREDGTVAREKTPIFTGNLQDEKV